LRPGEYRGRQPKLLMSNTRHCAGQLGLAMYRIIALACFIIGMGAGASIYKYKLFPVSAVRAARNVVLGDPLDRFMANDVTNPRNSVFEAFHPHADIVMIGDSITNNGEWQEMFPGVSIANRGIASARSDHILRRLPTILESTPKEAFLMFGVNDLSILQSVDVTFANYKEIVAKLQAAGVAVVIQSTLECSRSHCGEVVDHIKELNARLRDFAASKNIRYIDINAGLTSESEGLLRQFTFDGIHLTGPGYVKWRAALTPYIPM
jgi:lysophospholipase L1-like esterase